MSVNLYTVSLASLVSEPNPYPTINVPIALYTNSNHTTPFLPYTDASATNVLSSNVITSDRLGYLNLFAQPGTYYGTNPDLGNITITVTNPGSGAFDTRYAAANDSRITGAAQTAQNLADLASASAARTSLGLGTAATQASTVFAPAMVVGTTWAALTAYNAGATYVDPDGRQRYVTAGYTSGASFGATDLASTVVLGQAKLVVSTTAPVGLASGTEYCWIKTDGSGGLVDILTGVA